MSDAEIHHEQPAPVSQHGSLLSYSLYGLTLTSNFFFASSLMVGKGEPDLNFTCVTTSPCPRFWKQATLVYQSPFQTEDGSSDYCLYQQATCTVLRFTDIADFYVWPEHITCHCRNPRRQKEEVEILFLGSVLSYWLEQRGFLALHASAVVVGEHAAAFLAHHHGGKSSMAASLMQEGYPLLTDDILPLEKVDNRILGRPGYPQMRMWPEQARYFWGRCKDLERVHPKVDKRRVPIGLDGLGSFCDSPQLLKCFYLPQRRHPDDTDLRIKIQPISPLHALRELVRHAFLPQTVEALGLQPQRLRLLSYIANRVPLRQIQYPSGFEHLPRVSQAIIDDLHTRNNFNGL